MELKREDVFIFKVVSESFPEYFFLSDHRLVSEIVHGYLLIGDLVDYKAIVKDFITEYDATSKQLQTATLPESEVHKQLDSRYSITIEKYWKEFQQKVGAIEKRFGEILLKVGSGTQGNKRG